MVGQTKICLPNCTDDVKPIYHKSSIYKIATSYKPLNGHCRKQLLLKISESFHDDSIKLRELT